MSPNSQNTQIGSRRRRRSSCFDPPEKTQLVLERRSKPGFVYRLYVASQDEGQPAPTPRLLRTYISYTLANHDALCWVLHQQKKAGAKVSTCTKNEEYERKSEGRCSCIHTNVQSWGRCFLRIQLRIVCIEGASLIEFIFQYRIAQTHRFMLFQKSSPRLL